MLNRQALVVAMELNLADLLRERVGCQDNGLYVRAFVQMIISRAKETGLPGYRNCGGEKTNEMEELDLEVWTGRHEKRDDWDED
jgi:hypothetical protein